MYSRLATRYCGTKNLCHCFEWKYSNQIIVTFKSGNDSLFVLHIKFNHDPNKNVFWTKSNVSKKFFIALLSTELTRE